MTRTYSSTTYIKERIYEFYTNYVNNLEFEIVLSLLIQGSFYTVTDRSENEHNKVIQILGEISEDLMKRFSL